MFGQKLSYRTLNQNVIILIKPNSILMDFNSTHSNSKKSSSNQAQKDKYESKTIQDLQKLYKKGTFDSTHPNLKKNMKIMEKDDHSIQKCQESSKYYPYLKIIIILDFMFQFSLLLGLILVQCITSSFQDSIFTFMLVAFIVVYVLALGTCVNLQGAVEMVEQRLVKKRQGENKNEIIIGEEKMMPTVPKIYQEFQVRLAKKTRKLQYGNNDKISLENTQQTIKKDPMRIIDNNINKDGKVKIRNNKRYAFGFFKVLRIILSVVFPSICLSKLTDDKHEIIIKTLSITIYIITIAFSIVLAFFCKTLLTLESTMIINLDKRIENDHPPIETLDKCLEGQGPQTKISIEQLISVHNASRKKAFSIQKDFSSTKPSPSQNDSQIQKQHSDPNSHSERNNEQVQRIILKSSKSNLKKIRKQILDSVDDNNKLCAQRKKVEINSNKIQYFQYSEITQSYHSRSIVEDKEFVDKLKRKAKYSGQRSKYMQQKIQNQAQILKRMRINRQKKTKSSICFGGQNQMDHRRQQHQISPSYFLS